MDFCNNMTPEQHQRLHRQLLRGARPEGSRVLSCATNLTYVSDELVTGEMPVTPACLNPLKNVHGGCLATLADTVAGTAAAACGDACVTLSCNLNYLRPANGSVIRCEARPQKRGKTITVVDVALYDDKNALVTNGVFTFYRVGAMPILREDQLLERAPTYPSV